VAKPGRIEHLLHVTRERDPAARVDDLAAYGIHDACAVLARRGVRFGQVHCNPFALRAPVFVLGAPSRRITKPSRFALRYSPLGRPGGRITKPSRFALRYSPLGRPGGL